MLGVSIELRPRFCFRIFLDKAPFRPDQKVIEAHASDLGPQIVGKSLAYFIERRKAVRILNRTVWSFISTIIRRESHWQSRVLRNDLHRAWKPRGIRSLSG